MRLFDPTNPDSAAYNPLLEVRRGEWEVRDVQNVANTGAIMANTTALGAESASGGGGGMLSMFTSLLGGLRGDRHRWLGGHRAGQRDGVVGGGFGQHRQQRLGRH